MDKLKDKINVSYHRYRMNRNRQIINALLDATGATPEHLRQINERFKMAQDAYRQSMQFLVDGGYYVDFKTALRNQKELKAA